MESIKLIQTVEIPLGQIVENRGQIEGLPANPRKISISKLRKLVQSIREYPWMVALRELLVYPYKGKFIIIGGNMRRRAMKELGYTEAPCKVIPEGTSVDLLRAYVLRDNSHFGEWDFSVEGFDFSEFDLSNVEAPTLSVPPITITVDDTATPSNLEEPDTPAEAIHRPTPYQQQGAERLCDLAPRRAMHFRAEFGFLSSFNQSETGLPLSSIKTDEYVDLFAKEAFYLLRMAVKAHSKDSWVIVTTPFRRHKEGNFADKICRELSVLSGIQYLPCFAEARNRDRIAPVFVPQFTIEQPNVILYDDIVTTASTLRAMHDLLTGKNVLTLVGINNN